LSLSGLWANSAPGSRSINAAITTTNLDKLRFMTHLHLADGYRGDAFFKFVPWPHEFETNYPLTTI
jgi:hypothetical protein